MAIMYNPLANPSRFSNESASYTVSYHYINNTKHPLCVISADGSHVRLEARATLTGYRDGVTVVVVHNAKKHSRMNPHTHTEDYATHKKLMEAAGSQGIYRYQYEYNIPTNKLKDNKGKIYLKPLDAFIIIDDGSTIPKHPRLEQSINEHVEYLDKEALNASIFIVDNYDNVGPRYINIYGVVTKVNSRKNLSFEDGIYLTIRNTAKDGEEIHETKLYDIDDENCPIKLYSTFGEAMRDGDMESFRRDVLNRELEKLQLKNQELEEANKNAKLEYELDKKSREKLYNRQESELKSERERLEHRRKELESEILHKRKINDSDRKEATEWIKMGSTILSIGVLILTVLNKASK